ncbi:MAG: hypothetical protein V1701_02905 [Planctomycetota bacterium]
MAKKTGYHLRSTQQIPKGKRVAGLMYRGNPYPGYMGYRPLSGNPVAALTRSIVHPFNMEGLKTLGGVTAGFAGTALLPTRKLIEKIPVIGTLPILPVLIANGINITLLASVAQLLLKNREVTGNVMAGGLAATGLQIVGSLAKSLPNVTALQKVSSSITMAGLGQNAAERTKKLIEERIRKEMEGLPAESSYSTVRGLPAEPSYSVAGVGGDDLTEDTLD